MEIFSFLITKRTMTSHTFSSLSSLSFLLVEKEEKISVEKDEEE